MKCKVCKFEYKKRLCPVCNIIVSEFGMGEFREPIGKDLTLEEDNKK
jgi:rubredoxin